MGEPETEVTAVDPDDSEPLPREEADGDTGCVEKDADEDVPVEDTAEPLDWLEEGDVVVESG